MATIRLLLILLIPIAGCSSSKEVPCTEAYNHLVTIAKQEPEPAVQERFVNACVDAWDGDRIDCLMKAEDADEASACRAGRVPPG